MTPYSAVRRAGQLFAISGQTGVRDGALVQGGFEAELEQVFVNLDGHLKKSRLRRSDVVKTNVYLIDIADWERLNQPYVDFFGDMLPARTTVAVAALPGGARVEIEAWALYSGSHT